MKLKTLTLFAVLATMLAGTVVVTTTPAEAKRKSCYYSALDHTGREVARGSGYAKKKSKSCDRARRRCNRELDRKIRKGKVGRGAVCRRPTEVSG